MVAAVIEQQDGGYGTLHMVGRDDQPVDLRTGLVRTEPHPYLPARAESGERRALFHNFGIDLRCGGHLAVHLLLEDIQDLLPALRPLFPAAHLAPVGETQRVFQRIRQDGILVIIDGAPGCRLRSFLLCRGPVLQRRSGGFRLGRSPESASNQKEAGEILSFHRVKGISMVAMECAGKVNSTPAAVIFRSFIGAGATFGATPKSL